MSIKKNIFAPLASGLGATRRAAMLLLVMMLTTATAWATDKTLSGSESYTAQNGDVLTGSTSGTVTIDVDAKITLSDVTITGGIVCAGTAEITLVGTNSVTGSSIYDSNIKAYRRTAGIQIGGDGTTLTIKGDGSLTANGAQYAAGIGLNAAWDVTEDVIGGNIVIESGIIAANGGVGAAGIGAGFTKDPNNSSERKAIVGNITIKGGTVTAVGVTADGGHGADGIGAGDNIYNATYQIGTVTIYDDIDKVDASSIKDFNNVIYMHGETNVTANKIDYFTITEDGNRRIIVPNDDTDYTITIADDIEHGTLTGAATAKYMENVTITATPALGYRFSRLVVKDAQNNNVESTGNSFFMPKSNVTVSAVFEQGTHGTTEFKLHYSTGPHEDHYESIYDGVTTVNIQQTERSYNILKYSGNNYSNFLLDNATYDVNIPYAGGTGEFTKYDNGTNFRVPYDGETGFYDITMNDAGGGKWSVSILKTVAVMDAVPDQTYTGSEITPEPTVIAGSLSLTKGTDYKYSYMNNTVEGTQAKVTVNFLGDYAWLGSVERTFNIICEHTITYDLAGGTVATENPTTYTIVSGDITLTTPTREGYTFTGWTGTDLTEPTMTVTIASGSTGDRQYTATWTMTWANVKAALQAGQSVTLANDVTRVNSECIVPSGTVTLDLNGYTIDGGTTQTNPLFRIGDGVSLTITDSQTGGNLCNAGQNATVSDEGGTLTLAGGTINAQASGVFMWRGNFNMTGGTITGGSSYGVYLNGDNVSFTMTGGTITGNETGVNVGSANATFTVSGNVNITGNTKNSITTDVSLNYDYQSSTLSPIHIGGALNEAARIGINIDDYAASAITGDVVKVITNGLEGKGTKQNFVLNGRDGHALVINATGEVGIAANTWIYNMTLADNADNSTDIANHNGETADVTLSDRTLYKDGAWNTLCLPFSLSAEQIAANTDFAGATLMTMDVTKKNGFDVEDGTLYLWFKTATTIEAGVPYLVKWEKAADYEGNEANYDINNPVFEGVTVSSTAAQAVESTTAGLESVQMVGCYSPVSVTADDKSILFLGDANTLYYSTVDRQIRSCRAYFSVPYINGHAEAKARAFALSFDGEETTGILEVSANSNEVKDDMWYSLDGVRLSGKPTQRGMYINKGKKILVK